MDLGSKTQRKGVRSPVQKFLALTIGLFTLAACDNKKKADAVSELPQRSGSLIVSTSVKFNDVKPTLSSDGTRLVFVSGRDTDGDVTVLKAYKAEWPEAAAPGAPARLTLSDVGFERDARISPDGNWVVLSVQKDGKTDLYLQDFAGTLPAPLNVSGDAADEIDPVFSPDSKLITWISRDVGAGTSQVLGVTVGTGTAADVATKVVLSAAGEYVTTLFWIPTATDGTYELAVGTQGDFSTGGTSLNTISFTAIADAQAAARTAWLQNQFLLANTEPRATATAVLLGRKAPQGSVKKVTALGAGVTPRMTPVSSEPIFAAPAAAAPATVTELAMPPGHDLLAVGGITPDGTAGFGIFRLAYRHACDPASAAYDFSSSIAAFKADGTAATFYIPRTTPTEGAFEVAKDVCDMMRADGTLGRPDDKVMDLVVNANATEAKLRALYVTRFTAHFDETCRIKAGDPEVFGLDVVAGAATIQPVSNNRAPITDTPLPAGAAACAL